MEIELKNLILTFHQRQVVEKIIESKGRKFFIEKSTLEKELKNFAHRANRKISDNGYVISSDSYQIYPADALQIAFICIMTGISENDLFKDWRKLQLSLYSVKGEYKQVAKKIGNIIENTSLSLYDEMSLLKQVI